MVWQPCAGVGGGRWGAWGRVDTAVVQALMAWLESVERIVVILFMWSLACAADQLVTHRCRQACWLASGLCVCEAAADDVGHWRLMTMVTLLLCALACVAGQDAMEGKHADVHFCVVAATDVAYCHGTMMMPRGVGRSDGNDLAKSK